MTHEQSAAVEDFLKAKVDAAAFRVACKFSLSTEGVTRRANDTDDRLCLGSRSMDIPMEGDVWNWQTDNQHTRSSSSTERYLAESPSCSSASDSWVHPVAQWPLSYDMSRGEGSEISGGIPPSEREQQLSWFPVQDDAFTGTTGADVISNWDSTFWKDLERCAGAKDVFAISGDSESSL
jgi:hypothetical protein